MNIHSELSKGCTDLAVENFGVNRAGYHFSIDNRIDNVEIP